MFKPVLFALGMSMIVGVCGYKQAGKGKITFVESVTKGSSVVAYEAKIKTAGKTSEIKVSPEGAAVKEP